MSKKLHQNSLRRYLRQTALPCYTPQQVQQLEQDWFDRNDAFGLMQQAAWQMAQWITSNFPNAQKSVLIVVGSGNNGGDGWALASFLSHLCPNWQINVLQLAPPTTDNAKQAKKLFYDDSLNVKDFLQNQKTGLMFHFDIIIDGLFGIGLDRKPTGDYGKIIDWINAYKNRSSNCQIISIDVPSGLNATTGDVYDKTAIKAHITLCLIARKVGLHLKNSKDYVGNIIDIPLIPTTANGAMYYHQVLPTFPKRSQNSHKGSYGHVLVIGGNQLDTGQGMGGASLLAASCAFVSGVGKVTVACHPSFHAAIINQLPNAMTAELHSVDTVKQLIAQVDVVTLGMGLGRDKTSEKLFNIYLEELIQSNKPFVIDADGLYHLATFCQRTRAKDKAFIKKLKNSQAYYTPHSGEAGRLLETAYQEVDNDKIAAIQALTTQYGGHWLIKGSETLVLENETLHICGFGNPGMATAGMGDCLAGLVAGILAQQNSLQLAYPLLTATLMHAKAGDNLADEMGEYALEAKMVKAIGEVMYSMTD